MSLWSMDVQYSSFTRSARSVTKLLTSSLWLDTKDGAYLDNRVNFKHTQRYHVFFAKVNKFLNRNCSHLRGKYIPKNALLNSSHSIESDSTVLLSFYWFYHTGETSLNWYKANSAFSQDVPPIALKTLYTPSRNS